MSDKPKTTKDTAGAKPKGAAKGSTEIKIFKAGEAIPGDDVHPEAPAAIHELTPEQRAAALEKKIKHELSNFDIAKASVSKIVTKYDKLIIAPIENQEQYETIEAARKHAKSLAVAVGKKEKNLKEDYLKITRAIGAYASELSIPLRGVEDRLEAAAEVWEEKLKEAERQKEKEAAEKLEARIQRLEAAGIKFDGRYYSIGDHISQDIITIKESTDEEIDTLVKAVETERDRLDELEAERQRELERQRQAEEQQRQQVETQRQENERKQNELLEQQRQLQQQQAEMLQMRTDMRVQQLDAAGLKYLPTLATNGTNHAYAMDTPSGKVEVSEADVQSVTNQEWDIRIAGIRDMARDIIQKEENRKKAEIERLNKMEGRIDQLIQLGFKRQMPDAIFVNDVTKNSKKVTICDADKYSQTEWEAILKDAQSWINNESTVAKDIQDKAAKEAETKRQAGLSDLERIREYAEALNAIKTPELSLESSRGALLIFKSSIDAASDRLIQALS